MKKLLLFAGTTEGRELAQYLYRCRFSCDICVATEYGALLLEEHCRGHRIHRGRLDRDSMIRLAEEIGATHIVDATHPYAKEVSANIRACAQALGLVCLRLVRPELAAGKPVLTAGEILPQLEADPAGREEILKRVCAGGYICADSVREAVRFLEYTDGAILAATGSRELEQYCSISGWQDRVYARVLSAADSMEAAVETGFSGSHLICMQGPFNAMMNRAVLQMTGAKWMVTKESGHAGGFPEKLEAAAREAATLVVVGRPAVETGDSPASVRRYLNETFGLRPGRTVTLAGIGPGDESEMTGAVRKSLREADLLIGAARMMECVRTVAPALPVLEEYRAGEIVSFLAEHPEYEKVVVALSGDPGFFSGAASLRRELERRMPETEVRTLAGVSCVSRLCALLDESWEDAVFATMHGRTDNIPGLVLSHPKVFILLGAEDGLETLCRTLLAYGLGDVKLYAGCRLSYPEERVISGSPREMLDQMMNRTPEQTSDRLPDRTSEQWPEQTSDRSPDQTPEQWPEQTSDQTPDQTPEQMMDPGMTKRKNLTVVLVKNAQAQSVPTFGLPDEAFLRTQVPMTKSEVRALSLSRLRLSENSVVYDVGAGTGSVSVEMGRLIPRGHVFAIERNEQALDLIRQNAQRLGASCVEVTAGTAPEVFSALPAPTHALIGGSGGRMSEILEALLKKNPEIRIVINAVSLETIAEITGCIRHLPVEEEEILCVNIARGRKTGQHHLMYGQNPIYIITLRGNNTLSGSREERENE